MYLTTRLLDRFGLTGRLLWRCYLFGKLGAGLNGGGGSLEPHLRLCINWQVTLTGAVQRGLLTVKLLVTRVLLVLGAGFRRLLLK